MIPSILKNMSLALEGVGYLGKAEELVLPKLTLKTEEHRGGGMDAPVEIDQGMEALVSEWTMAGIERDMVARFGSYTDRLVFRGAYQNEAGDVVPVKVQQSGRIKATDLGNWKSGEKAGTKFEATLSYLEIVIDGRQVVEIDVENMVRRIGGVDQLAAQRAAIEI